MPDVRTPHNVGAALRAGAHFGARAAILAGGALPPAAYRTSEGGAEGVDLVFPDSLAHALEACRRGGVSLLATTSHKGRDLFASHLPQRVVVLLGAEDRGLPDDLLRQVDVQVRIPGTGWVESLNVASAAAVLLGELWRRRASSLVEAKRRKRLETS